MKNSEKDYVNEQKSNSMMSEKTNQDFNKRKPILSDPNEIEGKPAIPLPIIGEVTPTKETPDNNKADKTIEAEDIDSGNNYTAAENENQTNSTL